MDNGKSAGRSVTCWYSCCSSLGAGAWPTNRKDPVLQQSTTGILVRFGTSDGSSVSYGPRVSRTMSQIRERYDPALTHMAARGKKSARRSLKKHILSMAESREWQCGLIPNSEAQQSRRVL
jgi:hypothetical protein